MFQLNLLHNRPKNYTLAQSWSYQKTRDDFERKTNNKFGHIHCWIIICVSKKKTEMKS